MEQKVPLFLGLDSFRDDLQPEAAPHLDDRAHDGGVVGIGRCVGHERPVDLERADRELLQGAQAGVPRAEIVDRQVDTHRAQLVEQRQRALRIEHECRLGDLEFDTGGGHL